MNDLRQVQRGMFFEMPDSNPGIIFKLGALLRPAKTDEKPHYKLDGHGYVCCKYLSEATHIHGYNAEQKKGCILTVIQVVLSGFLLEEAVGMDRPLGDGFVKCGKCGGTYYEDDYCEDCRFAASFGREY